MLRSLTLAFTALASLALPAARPAHAAETAAYRNITCSSRGYDRTYCASGTDAARLVRQLSDAPCRRGQSWGTDRRGLWVSRGCRGVFAVGYDDRRDDRYNDRYDDRRGRGRGRDDDRYDGRYDDRYGRGAVSQAERACERAVERRLDLRGREVDTRYVGRDRRGLRVVRWDARRHSGTCRVTDAGRIADLDVRRRR